MASGDQSNPATPGDSGALSGPWRAALAVAAVGAIALAGWLWLSPQQVSRTKTAERVVRVTVVPASEHKRSPKQRTTRTTSTKTTVTLNGVPKKGERPAAPAATSRRSETLAIALLGFGGLLLTLAAAGRKPTKLGLGPATMETPVPAQAVTAVVEALKNRFESILGQLEQEPGRSPEVVQLIESIPSERITRDLLIGVYQSPRTRWATPFGRPRLSPDVIDYQPVADQAVANYLQMPDDDDREGDGVETT